MYSLMGYLNVNGIWTNWGMKWKVIFRYTYFTVKHDKMVYYNMFFVLMYVYVQLSAWRLVGSSYTAGTRCTYPHCHAHAYTYTCTRRHTLINTHTAHLIPPPRGILSQELNGVGWCLCRSIIILIICCLSNAFPVVIKQSSFK